MRVTRRFLGLGTACLSLLFVACTPVIFRSLSPDEAVLNPCSGVMPSPGVSLTVVDVTDALIPGAEVTLMREPSRSREAEMVASAETDTFGFASLMLTEAGRYEVRVYLSGFYETRIRHLRVDSGCHVDLGHIALEINTRIPICEYGGFCHDR